MPANKSNELDQILIYDLGFCYLMMLNFEQALAYFNKSDKSNISN